jgi:hypothetical protein
MNELETLVGMDEYQKLSTINDDKQKNLNTIKSICTSLDNAERILKEKIEFRHRELDTLKKDYSNIVETYGHIIRSFVRQTC